MPILANDCDVEKDGERRKSKILAKLLKKTAERQAKASIKGRDITRNAGDETPQRLQSASIATSPPDAYTPTKAEKHAILKRLHSKAAARLSGRTCNASSFSGGVARADDSPTIGQLDQKDTVRKRPKVSHRSAAGDDSVPQYSFGKSDIVRPEETLEQPTAKKKKKKKTLKKTSDQDQIEEDRVDQLSSEDVPEVSTSSPQTSSTHSDKSEKGVSDEPAPEAVPEKYPILGVDHFEERKPQSVVPDWINQATPVSSSIAHDSIQLDAIVPVLSDFVLGLFARQGITHLFPVQAQVIPELLDQAVRPGLLRPPDICVAAPTGSGKTLCYAVPIIANLHRIPSRGLRALVMVPVQELAIQVHDVFAKCADGTNLKVVLLSSKAELAQETKKLVKPCRSFGLQNQADIVISTPGRLLDQLYLINDLAKEKRIEFHWLGRLQYLVIDEADRMMSELKLDWLNEVEKAVYYSGDWSGNQMNDYRLDDLAFDVTLNGPLFTPRDHGVRRYKPGIASLRRLSASLPVQKILLSATLSHDVERLQELNLYQPRLFQTSSTVTKKSSTDMEGDVSAMPPSTTSVNLALPPELEEQLVICEPKMKPLVCYHLIKENGEKWLKVLCFCNSKQSARRLRTLLGSLGLNDISNITGNIPKQSRATIFKTFNDGEIKLLIATDLLARGIDVENVDAVISYDPPLSIQAYVHRVGRTARAGRGGTAVTLLSSEENKSFRSMLDGTSRLQELSDVAISPDDLKPYLSSYKDALGRLKVLVAREKLRKSQTRKHQWRPRRKTIRRPTGTVTS